MTDQEPKQATGTDGRIDSPHTQEERIGAISGALGASGIDGANTPLDIHVDQSELEAAGKIATGEDVYGYFDRTLLVDASERTTSVKDATTRLLNAMISMTNKQPEQVPYGRRPAPGRPIIVPISTEDTGLETIPRINNSDNRNRKTSITTAQFCNDYCIDMVQLGEQLADKRHTEAYPNVGKTLVNNLNGFLADFQQNNPQQTPPAQQ